MLDEITENYSLADGAGRDASAVPANARLTAREELRAARDGAAGRWQGDDASMLEATVRCRAPLCGRRAG